MNLKAYWSYSWKKEWPYVLALSGVELLLYMFCGFIAGQPPVSLSDYSLIFLAAGAIIAVLSATLFPLIHESRFFSKRSVDLYLALPWSREGSWLNDAAIGLAEVLGCFTLTFFIGSSFTPLFCNGALLSAYALFLIYGSLVLLLLISYATAIGILSFADNLLDGLILLAMGVATPIFIGVAAMLSGTTFAANNAPVSSVPNLDTLAYCFPAYGICERTYLLVENSLAGGTTTTLFLYPFFIHLILALGISALGFYHFRSWKAENAGFPSKSWFSYPFWFTLDTAFSMAILTELAYPNGASFSFTFMAIGVVLYYLVDCLNYRKIIPSWQRLAWFVGRFLGGYLLGIILVHI